MAKPGRRPETTQENRLSRKLSDVGATIRDISSATGLSYSRIQRLLTRPDRELAGCEGFAETMEALETIASSAPKTETFTIVKTGHLPGSTVKAARFLIGWSTHDLTSACGISTRLLHRVESDTTTVTTAHDKIIRAFSRAGVEISERTIRGPPRQIQTRLTLTTTLPEKETPDDDRPVPSANPSRADMADDA